MQVAYLKPRLALFHYSVIYIHYRISFKPIKAEPAKESLYYFLKYFHTL